MMVHTIGVKLTVHGAMLLIIWTGFFGLLCFASMFISRRDDAFVLGNKQWRFILVRMIFRNLSGRFNRFALDVDCEVFLWLCQRVRADSFPSPSVKLLETKSYNRVCDIPLCNMF